MYLRRHRARRAAMAALPPTPSQVRRQASRLRQASTRAFKDADVALAAVAASNSRGPSPELEQLLEQEVAAAGEAHARLVAMLAAVRQAKLTADPLEGGKG